MALMFNALCVALAGAGVLTSTPALLQALFHDSQRVGYVELSAAEVTTALGRAHDKVVVYVARTGTTIDGFAIVEDEKGQHQPITFGVQVDPRGRIARVEVMAYREAYGGEIKDPRFLRQFVGRTITDVLKPGLDIDGITGATISSRSASVVVHRALVLCALAKAKLEQAP